MKTVLKYLAAMPPGQLLWPLLTLGSGLLLWWWSRKRTGIARTITGTLAVFLMIRFLLLENPLTWLAYDRLLDNSDVGWRQKRAVSLEARRYFSQKSHSKYLVVGSSQVPAYFLLYSRVRREPGVNLFWLAGMTPLDYVLYEKEIESQDTDTIILVISELELFRAPDLRVLKLSPFQGLAWPSLASRLHSRIPPELSPEDGIAPYISSNILGALFPEYRYRFIFRALTDHLLGEHRALGGEMPLPEDLALRDAHLVSTLKNLDSRYLSFNRGFLEDFLRFVTAHGKRVVLVKSQYRPSTTHHPELDETRLDSLRILTETQLEEIATKHPLVTMIPAAILPRFPDEDYIDIFHVKFDAGWKMAEAIINFLENPENWAQKEGAPGNTP